MRARYDAPIEITAAEEGPPSSDARWNIGRHCTLRVLRASACLAPVALTQNEIGRTDAQMGAGNARTAQVGPVLRRAAAAGERAARAAGVLAPWPTAKAVILAIPRPRARATARRRNASTVLGVHETPHRMGHVVGCRRGPRIPATTQSVGYSWHHRGHGMQALRARQ